MEPSPEQEQPPSPEQEEQMTDSPGQEQQATFSAQEAQNQPRLAGALQAGTFQADQGSP